MIAARLLREARRRSGLTQRALAAKARIPQSTIARIERQQLTPRVDTLVRLLAATGHTLDLRPTGAGVDRTQIRELLRLTPGERARLAVMDAANLVWMSRTRDRTRGRM